MTNRGTALVTGGCGFIGAHLVRRLQNCNRCNVLVLDDLSGGFRDNLPSGTDFVKGSVCDEELVEELFNEYKFDYIYHLGAYAAEGLSHFIRRYNYANNLIGSVNLINQAILHEAESFVFTSSVAVYGDAPVPMTEDMKPDPEDPYGIAKYAVELDLQAAQEMFGLDYVIFRPHNVYGEYQNIGDKYRNVVGIFMNQVLKGEPMTVFGDGEQERAFSYVGDIIDPIAESPWVAEAKNEVFNIGADEPYTVNELADHVARAMGVPEHPVEHLPARNEVKVAYCDHEKVRDVFGEAQRTSLEAGLERMSDWVKSVGAREGQDFSGIEVAKNMPPSWKE